MNKPKPCPFCGSDEIHASIVFTAYMCKKCDCCGPEGDGWEDALSRWNGRASGVKPIHRECVGCDGDGSECGT